MQQDSSRKLTLIGIALGVSLLLVALSLFYRSQAKSIVTIIPDVESPKEVAVGTATKANSSGAVVLTYPPVIDTQKGSANFPKPINSLRNEPGVMELLDSANRDAESFFENASQENIKLMRRGAYKVLGTLSSCLLDKKDCGFDKSEWQNYYSVGGPQAFYILERALNFLLVSLERGNEKPLQITVAELVDLMAVRVQSTSILASSLAFKSAANESEMTAVINAHVKLNPTALPLFFQMAMAETKAGGRENLNQEIKSKIVQIFTSGDTDRSDELLPHLASLELAKGDLVKIAQTLCGPTKSATAADADLINRRKISLKKQFEMSNNDSSFPASCQNN